MAVGQSEVEMDVPRGARAHVKNSDAGPKSYSIINKKKRDNDVKDGRLTNSKIPW